MTKYSILLFERKYLIVKTAEGRTPFVIAEIYLKEAADQICALLNKNEQESNEG